MESVFKLSACGVFGDAREGGGEGGQGVLDLTSFDRLLVVYVCTQ